MFPHLTRLSPSLLRLPGMAPVKVAPGGSPSRRHAKVSPEVVQGPLWSYCCTPRTLWYKEYLWAHCSDPCNSVYHLCSSLESPPPNRPKAAPYTTLHPSQRAILLAVATLVSEPDDFGRLDAHFARAKAKKQPQSRPYPSPGRFSRPTARESPKT